MPTPVGAAVGQRPARRTRGALDERRRPRAVHVPEQDPHAATASRNAGARPRRRTSATPTPFRHGWPATGQTRARQPAHRTSTYSSSCGTPHGRQRTGGTVGAKSETTGVPTAAARCAGPGVADDDRVGARQHAGQLGERRRARRGRRRASPATRAVSSRSPGAAGDDDLAAASPRAPRRAPRCAPAPTPAPARDAPGWTTTYVARDRAGRSPLIVQPIVVAGAASKPAARDEESARSTSCTSSEIAWRTSSSEPG